VGADSAHVGERGTWWTWKQRRGRCARDEIEGLKSTSFIQRREVERGAE